MKKRLIALFLCSALIFGMVPTVLANTLGKGDFQIYYNSSAVESVVKTMEVKDASVVLSAWLEETASGSFQWQINVPSNGKWSKTWITAPVGNLPDATLTYGMVGQFMVDGKAKVRATFTTDGKTMTSDEVYLSFVVPESVPVPDSGSADLQVTPGTPSPAPAAQPAPAAPVQDAPATPEQESPAGETPSDETPSGETPSGETPSDETPSGETPSGETPSGETPSDETPAGNIINKIIGGLTGTNTLDGDAPVGGGARAGEPDVKQTYNIVINYKFEDNTIVSDPYTANLAEGTAFSTTVTFPTVQGYLPYVGETQQNSIELNYTSVSEDVTINVVYKPTNVNYTVIHYQQNVDNDQYTVIETETKQGLTGSQVPEVAKEYEGFYHLVYERPNIAADGSTVIEVYYDRYYYLMNFDMDGGYGTEPVYKRYGADIGTVNAPTKAGYSFGGWSETEDGTTAVTLPTTMPAANKTYYAIWNPDSTAKVTIVFWGENADDEGYSYLADQTKVINLKPGREFTYSENEMLVCDKEVHNHTDACLGCGKTEHTHSAEGGCYTLNCNQESHTHGTGCYAGVGNEATLGSFGKPLNPSEGVVYEGILNTYIYIKGEWYYYTGSTASGSVAPTTCGKTETTHIHTNTCYNMTCTTEVHTHEQKCYNCGKEQHTHNSDCYMQGAGLDSKLWKFVKSDTITVAADGSSVVNVYYDRVEYSVQFYTRGNNPQEYTDLKITAKWGAYVGDKWPTVNESANWYVNAQAVGNSDPMQARLLQMPVGGDKFYGPKTSGNNTQSASYYVEKIDSINSNSTANYELHHTDTIKGNDPTVTTDDMYAIEGFELNTTLSTQSGGKYNGAKFYYTRNSYKLTFNDQYKDVKNETVKYEAPLSTYKDYVPAVPSAYEPGSVEFGGWYQNPQCTGEEYKLEDHKMPASDIILYAKWVPVTRTVKFYLTESSTEVYKPAKAETEASFTVPHASVLDEAYVNANLTKEAMNGAKPNGDYTFVMWYYYENGQKKPFDPSAQIRQDLTLYGEWSSNTLKEYTVQYVLKDDHSVKVADDLTGSGLAGTTKTFDAKGGTDLYAAYQEGYFPTVQSQSLLLDIDKETLTITFEYVPVEAVLYTVKYINTETNTNVFDGVTVADRVVSDNRKAVVTETFVPISGYMPDAYQKRLIVTADGENILYFYYTKDTEHAYYKITHYIQNTDGTTWTDYASSQASGDIGTRYTASPMTIPGYTYDHIEYVVNGTKVTDITAEGAKLTENGLEINLYYVRNEYPYQVRYLEQGSGNVLHDPKSGTGKYGQVISESAIDIDGYDKVDPTSVDLNIRIDEGEGAPNINIITFYYKEQEVTINYEAVGPAGATDFGSVSPTTETVKVKSGTAQGSIPTAGDGFKFVGWYTDETCTHAVNSDWVGTDNKIVPAKQDGKNVAATYYAKFEYDITSLTIQKSFGTSTQHDTNERYIFTVTGPDGYSNKVTVEAGVPTTIYGLKVGSTYTITEDNSWSWRYETSSNPTNGSITLTATDASNVVVFTNTLSKDNWLTGDSSAKNLFTGKTES